MTTDRPPLRWRETRALIRSDLDRLVPAADAGPFLEGVFAFLRPGFQGLLWYRLYRHLHLAGWGVPAKALYLFSTWTTRLDIPPQTSIGPGCRLDYPPIVLCGRIGERFTCLGFCGMGGGLESTDIGGGPGLPVVGDDVTFGTKVAVLGPVRIGDRARIGHQVVVTLEVPPGTAVPEAVPRVMRPAEAVLAPVSQEPLTGARG